MAVYKRGRIWWYKFRFAGQLICESSKSTSKTIAKGAEQQRRRGLELGFHNLKNVCLQRVCYLKDVIDEYLLGYRLRYRSATYAEYALGHASRWLGSKLIIDIDEVAVLRYQENRLRESAAPRSINEEVRLLLKMLGNLGEAIRARLKERRCLKLAVRRRIGKPSDPTRHVTSLKTAWNNVRKEAKVTGRWHDNRHTLITELAEAGAGEETIFEIAGHVDRQMIRHYSHIRMQAKRVALEAVLRGRSDSCE